MNKRYPAWTCLLWVLLNPLHGAQSPAPDSLRELATLKQPSNPARLEALQRILRERGIPFELESFESTPSPHGRKSGTNVAVTVGSGSREITLGAHYDAFEIPDGDIVDGMVDNGAAVIILVRVAEALRGKELRHRVRIVFFDMEEIGLVGSRAYVARHGTTIDAAIILDIAGLGKGGAIYGYGKAPGVERLRRALLMACADQILTCMDSEKYPTSDDRSFQAAGIPVVSIFMGPRLTLHQFWLFLNGGRQSGLEKDFMPSILTLLHSSEDNIEKIDPAALDEQYELVLNTLLRLDASLK